MDLPLLKNDIPNNLEPQKPIIYSRYSRLNNNKKAEPNDPAFVYTCITFSLLYLKLSPDAANLKAKTLME